MSDHEHDRSRGESLSSVKLGRTARGEVTPEVKVYSVDNSPEAINAAQLQAQTVYDALVARYCEPAQPRARVA